MTYYSISNQKVQEQNLLHQIVLNRNPDCIVAIGNYAAFLATSIKLPVPMWADLCGNYMAEAQAKAVTYNDDTYLKYFLQMEKVILNHFDFFSTVSDAQKYAVIGELGQNYRLNKYNYGQELAFTIPISSDPSLVKQPANQILRGNFYPENAFCLLWSGGFNTWTDIDTLFQGVNRAMEARPELHMVITGGQIDGHDEITFPRFRSMVETSLFKDGYHFAGWVENADLPAYYYESDLGIILDKWSYEGLLGSRSRILEWANYGMPVISTITSQLLQELNTAGVIFSFEHGNGKDLADTLLRAIENRATLPQTGKTLRRFTRENYAADKIFIPLLNWMNSLQRARDLIYVNQSREELIVRESVELPQQEALNSDSKLSNWARYLQSEMEGKEYQITKLWRELQQQKAEFERLSEWALSLEQQLLLRQSNSKYAE